eukprot:14803449-Alexandrium_andersonii.AAC.1
MVTCVFLQPPSAPNIVGSHSQQGLQGRAQGGQATHCKATSGCSTPSPQSLNKGGQDESARA